MKESKKAQALCFLVGMSAWLSGMQVIFLPFSPALFLFQ
jgi:hypothetical protein